MAILADVIMAIRRRVHDSDLAPPRPLYADVFYEEAIERGLGRLNLDLGTTYTVATLPVKYEYLLDKRGTIEMAMVRGAEGASSDVSDSPDSPLQSIAVPGLSVAQIAASNDGPAFWLKLVDALEEEYAAALSTIPGAAEEAVEQAIMSRMSLRTGARRPFYIDEALGPVDVAVALAGSTVTLTWSKIVDEFFVYYEVQRDSDPNFTSPTQIKLETDNHVVEHDDEPVAGTWYYRVVTVNSNNMKSNSLVVTAVVP